MNEVPERKYPPMGKARDAFDRGNAVGEYQSLIEQTAFQRDKALKREKYYWILIIILIGAMAWIALTANYRVYAVRIDNVTGRIEHAEQLKATNYSPRDAEIKFFLREFINNTRTIGRDPIVFKTNWDKSGFFMTPEAMNKYTSMLQKEEFFSRIGKYTQQPNVTVLQEQPNMPNTYQIVWQELVYNDNGEEDKNLSRRSYVGLFSIAIQPPTKEDELDINPLGIRITDMNFQQQDINR